MLGPIPETGVPSVISAASSVRAQEKLGPIITELTIDEGVQQLNLEDVNEGEPSCGAVELHSKVIDLDELS